MQHGQWHLTGASLLAVASKTLDTRATVEVELSTVAAMATVEKRARMERVKRMTLAVESNKR